MPYCSNGYIVQAACKYDNNYKFRHSYRFSQSLDKKNNCGVNCPKIPLERGMTCSKFLALPDMNTDELIIAPISALPPQEPEEVKPSKELAIYLQKTNTIERAIEYTQRAIRQVSRRVKRLPEIDQHDVLSTLKDLDSALTKLTDMQAMLKNPEEPNPLEAELL